jgi:hypothetical protein
MMKDIFEGKTEMTENMYDEMMNEWTQSADQMQNMDKMMGEWGKTWDQEQMDNQFKLNVPAGPKLIQFQQ